MLRQPHAITDQKCVGKHSAFVGVWKYVVHTQCRTTHCTCDNYMHRTTQCAIC